MNLSRLASLAALALVCSGAASAITIKEYQGSKNGGRDIRELTVAYLSGMGAAYSWANSELEHDKQPLLFCQPRTLALRPDVLAQLLDKEIQNPLYKPDHPLEMALLFSLKRAFPCP